MPKRRANGTGTFRKRPDGRWESTFMIGWHPDGRRMYKTIYGKTQAELRQKVQAWKSTQTVDRIDKHEYAFSQWADMWFQIHRNNVSPTTAESYRYSLRKLKAYFGRRKIQDIYPYDIEVFLQKLREQGVATASISKLKGMLFQIMAKAEGNLLIPKNPVQFVEKIRQSGPVQKRPVFTAEEVQILMKELPFNRIGISIRLLLACGLRTQELLALQPKHISESGDSIQVEQAVCMVKGTVTLGPPKSRDSYRTIPVPPSLWECAKALRRTTRTFIWEERTPGKPCNPSFFRKQFQKALRSLPGVRVLTPHCCRHTYVSQMQALHVDLSTLQRIVGHSDIDMTKHYLTVQESILKEAAEKFSKAFPLE